MFRAFLHWCAGLTKTPALMPLIFVVEIAPLIVSNSSRTQITGVVNSILKGVWMRSFLVGTSRRCLAVKRRLLQLQEACRAKKRRVLVDVFELFTLSTQLVEEQVASEAEAK